MPYYLKLVFLSIILLVVTGKAVFIYGIAISLAWCFVCGFLDLFPADWLPMSNWAGLRYPSTLGMAYSGIN
jgi:hypothetical protein